MNKEGNLYTFLFSAVMVVIVAVVLSLASVFLKPYQQKNIRLDKMQNILTAIGIKANADEAEVLFNKYLKEELILNHKGEPISSNIRAFDVDLKKEEKKEKSGMISERLYPLFLFNIEGKDYAVIPMRGKGLWGPIWGFMALQEDYNTIYGISFGHKGETPGLGAEIATKQFQKQFQGKKIFDQTWNFVSVRVTKSGTSQEDPHQVDGISGGTVTSNGVSEMLKNTIDNYVPYLKAKSLQNPKAHAQVNQIENYHFRNLNGN